MTQLRIEWDYDPEDGVQRSAQAERFIAAWINPYGLVEWTCTDEDAFADLAAILEAAEEDDDDPS